ncbi:efflux RND transporter periplasmic adaptor subunit [Chromobacterium phragmitis]|uniref:efflux RND transporter periplasmic adaptor subunit n=1 Tax=Chromobacterium phragmitis TaxID=2202141 RepID=UPI003262E744
MPHAHAGIAFDAVRRGGQLKAQRLQQLALRRLRGPQIGAGAVFVINQRRRRLRRQLQRGLQFRRLGVEIGDGGAGVGFASGGAAQQRGQFLPALVVVIHHQGRGHLAQLFVQLQRGVAAGAGHHDQVRLGGDDGLGVGLALVQRRHAALLGHRAPLGEEALVVRHLGVGGAGAAGDHRRVDGQQGAGQRHAGGDDALGHLVQRHLALGRVQRARPAGRGGDRAVGLGGDVAGGEHVSRTRVLAPISGRIGRSAVSEGALVTSGQSATLATIQQLDPMYVDIVQSSQDLLAFKRRQADGELEPAGAAARLKLEDGAPYRHPGKLRFTELNVDRVSGAVTLRAEFPNPEGLLLPGMYVRAELEQGVRRQAVLAPQQGVARDDKGRATALVLGAGDKVEQRVLTTEGTHGAYWLVTTGLKAGDRLIVDGLQRARPGEAATPVALPAQAGRS